MRDAMTRAAEARVGITGRRENHRGGMTKFVGRGGRAGDSLGKGRDFPLRDLGGDEGGGAGRDLAHAVGRLGGGLP
jgi:hypothetical protein